MWSPGIQGPNGYWVRGVRNCRQALQLSFHPRPAGSPNKTEDGSAGRTVRRCRWHVRKDGTRLWGDGVVTPLREPGGSLRCFAKLLRDRSDQKEQKDLLRHRAQALADADEKKTVFLATLAHELRNPLAGVVNAMSILRLSSQNNPVLNPVLDQPPQDHRATGPEPSALDDLNDVARISTGKVQLRKECVELAAVVQNAVEATRPIIESRNHRLSMSLPDLFGGRSDSPATGTKYRAALKRGLIGSCLTAAAVFAKLQPMGDLRSRQHGLLPCAAAKPHSSSVWNPHHVPISKV